MRATSSRSALSASRSRFESLDDGERLDEQRLARPGAVVDDARHRAACRRPEREDGSAGALGHEVVLQVLAQRRVASERT